jgi:predicted nucleotidyltransferase
MNSISELIRPGCLGLTRRNSIAVGDLRPLAETLAEWADAAPDVPAVYLFGSRVRGDHRADSDVDVRLHLGSWKYDPLGVTAKWWLLQILTNFAGLKVRLPGPLHLHREREDDVDPAIRVGEARPVLVVRKAICVWTPPKPGSARA